MEPQHPLEEAGTIGALQDSRRLYCLHVGLFSPTERWAQLSTWPVLVPYNPLLFSSLSPPQGLCHCSGRSVTSRHKDAHNLQPLTWFNLHSE